MSISSVASVCYFLCLLSHRLVILLQTLMTSAYPHQAAALLPPPAPPPAVTVISQVCSLSTAANMALCTLLLLFVRAPKLFCSFVQSVIKLGFLLLTDHLFLLNPDSKYKCPSNARGCSASQQIVFRASGDISSVSILDGEDAEKPASEEVEGKPAVEEQPSTDDAKPEEKANDEDGQEEDVKAKETVTMLSGGCPVILQIHTLFH